MRALAVLFAVGLVACAQATGADDGDRPGVGVERAALGEPQNGFPSWTERVDLVWVNRARSDPQADLAGCAASACGEKACYSPKPPLVWSYTLSRSARFHSANLLACGAFDHPSPCAVVSNIGTLYTPGNCGGAASCACTGGSCSCGSGGCTAWDARITLFGGSPTGENIAENQGDDDPVDMFYQWLWESSSATACTFTEANGHRMNILTQSGAIGVGCADGSAYLCTQDFGGPASPSGKIVAGVHYPATGSISFRANWYDPAGPPKDAQVNIDGTCHAMTKERGVNANNATYLLANQSLSGCHHYVFMFLDAAGTLVTYPDTGSFGIGCSADWDSTRPASTCSCTPSCSGKTCGDDGCGGTCAPGCGITETCQGGQCVCNGATCGTSCCVSSQVCYQGACCTPSCSGKECGPDGCGGTCGHACTAPQVCALGACSASCPTGYENCGGSCAETQSDATHCGRCDLACAAGASCVAGACVCAGGLTDCPGAGCTDLATDPANCGACGQTCAVCQDGRCADGAAGAAGARQLIGTCGSAPGGTAAAGVPLLPLLALAWRRPRRAGRPRGR